MTVDELSPAVLNIAASHRQEGRPHAMHRVNDVFAVLLLLLVAISPLPLASNRPFFWAAGAILIGLLGLAYVIFLWSFGHSLRTIRSRLLLLGLPFGLFCGYLAIQLLLLGSIVPISFTDVDGQTLSTNTLSMTPGNTWLMLLQMLSYGTLFVLIVQVAANGDRAVLMLRVLHLVIAAYATYSLIALTQLGDTILGVAKWAYLGSATGTFVNRNSFATFLAIGVASGVAILAAEMLSLGRRRLPVSVPVALHTVALLVTAAALVATGSRMGAVAATFGGAVVVAVTTLKSRASLLSWIVRLVVLLALAGLLYSAFGTQVFERLDSLGTDANTRTTLYQQVIAMITARPWLGYGGGSFEFAFPLFQHPPLTADTVWDKAHSSYLELWAETGIVAGSLPMLAILGALLMAIANLIRSAGRLDINAAAVGAVAAVAVHSLVDFSLEVQAVAYIFVAILALAVAHRPPASPASRERR